MTGKEAEEAGWSRTGMVGWGPMQSEMCDM